MKPEDRDEARRLAALSMLEQSLANMRKQLSLLDWRADGGPEAEAFLHALKTGGSHPVLEKWQELRRTDAAHRPAPDPSDLNVRRLVILMVEALSRTRTRLGKGAARKQAATAVRQVFPATADAIRGWQDIYSLTPDDEKWIADALKRCGDDHSLIKDWFVKQIELVVDPAAAYVTRRILFGR
jgi:hypothetical protein